jgi:hypothetical protein
MFKRSFAAVAAMAASSIAFAQGTASVDLLNPAETTGTIPANTRIVDVFFDVASTDVWTAAGIRAVTENGAAIIYFDSELNTPGTQPGLFNGGTANKFTTMLSKPRGRDAAIRFTNAGAAAAGEYDPAGAVPVTRPGELNVAYFASPPETPSSPSADGYIGRIAVDISNVPLSPGFDINDYSNWGAGPLANVPSGSSVVLRSVAPSQPGGTAIATFDVPALNFSNWAMWYAPEPTTLILLALGGLAAIRRR